MHPEFTPEDIDRFWSKVDRTGGPDACWPWVGQSFHRFGYGKLYVPKLGNTINAHRAAWIITNGPISDGLFVCHNCPGGDNPPCVNPAHMFLGTSGENTRDREAKGRHPHLATRSAAGTMNPKAKLTDSQVLEARRRYAAENVSQAKLAKDFGISQQMMSKIVRSRHWTHLPSVEELKKAA